MRFLEGMIEFVKDAGVAPGSIDLVISNCVVRCGSSFPKFHETS